MAAINDLLNQIHDEELRSRIEQEVEKLSKTKKFGLVFEDHLPECTPLYDVPIRRGSLVARKTGPINEMYSVVSINGTIVTCCSKTTNEIEKIETSDLVCVAQFGEAIYPYLKPIDSICNAQDSELWHTLIEADNYHALQLLEYLYAGKVDCIYIDPPYNTGARDWKYNNNYVDASDTYRHSKWLSFMERRLKLAKRLLKPEDSVLIVTIDEKEYLHLGCLLEELFKESIIQMISCRINPQGAARHGAFARSDEYIFYVFNGKAAPQPLELSEEWIGVKTTTKNTLHWSSLIRTGTNNMRADRPNLFYPVFVSLDGKRFMGVGESLPLNSDRTKVTVPEGSVAIWPIHTDLSEGRWQINQENLLSIQKKGYLKLGGFTSRGMGISYLKSGEQSKVENGQFPVIGYNEDGSVIVDDGSYNAKFIPSTQWRISTHDASRNGTNLLTSILGDKRFSFPKSLYAVKDTIHFVLADKKDALVLDFFAGSGTTLHAVNLLNSIDGGARRCILVTNNEVSDEEAKGLRQDGLNPGDPEWEKWGIARYVTWPRTVCSIKGIDGKGNKLRGKYLETDIDMADGFEANAIYFKLGFLDKNSVALGRQLKELLPILWLKAGAHNRCPDFEDGTTKMLVYPENKFAILLDEKEFQRFSDEIKMHPEIKTIFIVTDSEAGYREMISEFEGKESFQLYRDYLDNFRINVRR